MAQTSTTLSGAKAHISNITGTDVSISTSGTISSTSTVLTGAGKLSVRDLVTVSGTGSNNKTFTVKEVVSTTEFTVEETISANDSADGSSDFTLDNTGFVTDKAKGDGYYSHPDGVHTVSYKVDGTLTGVIQMQGSLATTPTEDDWFDIPGTRFDLDQSTTISSSNFTGNFVWVRAKVTSVTAGSVTSILLNS
tara:strand:+ start:19 stop:597 length:579 start_codon:yes stop_codon:yes gene_type:complete